MPQLEVLRLTRCQNITDEGVGAVIARCRQLNSLDIGSLPRGAISNSSLHLMAQHIALCELDISSSDITTDGLITLVQASPQLRKLVITDCHSVAGELLQALGSSCSGLLELDARRVSNSVTSADIIALCTGCKMLHRVALGGTCDTGSGIGTLGAELSDAAIVSIGTLGQLEVLNLHSFQRSLPLDAPLLQICQTCTALKQLSLSNLEVSGEFLSQNTKILAKLKMLRLAACPGITFSDIHKFQQKSKNTEVRFREHRY